MADRESEALAVELIEQTCLKQGIQRGQLTLHADRGSSMSSKPAAFLLADLGVNKTHSRPHVSNDNAYSESQMEVDGSSPFSSTNRIKAGAAWLRSITAATAYLVAQSSDPPLHPPETSSIRQPMGKSGGR